MTIEDRLTPELREFLDSEGVTEAFLANVKHDIVQLDDIDRSFLWDDTPEGRIYWADLNIKYKNIQKGRK